MKRLQYNPSLPTFVQWNCRTIRLTEESAYRLWSAPIRTADKNCDWLTEALTEARWDARRVTASGIASALRSTDDRLGAP